MIDLKIQLKKFTKLSFFIFNPLCYREIKRIFDEFKPNIVLSWMNRASRLLPDSQKFNSVNIGRLGGYYKIKNYVNCDYLITNTIDLRNFVISKGWELSKRVYSKFC